MVFQHPEGARGGGGGAAPRVVDYYYPGLASDTAATTKDVF
jgi:hypothetical protein